MRSLSRRSLIEVASAVGTGLLLRANPSLAQCAVPARTPIEGPYFLGEPEEKYETGRGLVVQGRVLDAVSCAPVPGAVVVRWHANAWGIYEEYYRARMTLPPTAAFELRTIAPGQYASLDRHIHWYVTAPGYQPLLAQLQWTSSAVIGGTQTFDFSLTRG